MKRFQQLPTESAKIGRILFWLFPDDQNMFYRRGTWAHRATLGATSVRGHHGARQFNRAGARSQPHPRDLQVL
jgi:hypothetical protein